MDRKEMKRKYKETVLPMGVFKITNTANGKIMIGSSVNLLAILNRHKAQLSLNSHSNTILQAEWQQFGADAFVFEELERLKPLEDPSYDPAEDLAVLEEMWLEKLAPYGDKGYNEPKKTRL